MTRRDEAEWLTDFMTVRGLVNAADLCFFIEAGAPEDEYDCLVRLILRSMAQSSRPILTEIILRELETHFGITDARTSPLTADRLKRLMDSIEANFQLPD